MKEQNELYILAEMAAAHDGKLETAELIVDGAAHAKADGVILQIFDLDSYIAPSDRDFPLVKGLSLNQEKWAKVIEKANSLGLDVWANVFDVESAKFCKSKNIKGFKLHSANLENKKLVAEILGFKKEILLSVGGMMKGEVKETLDFMYTVDKEAKVVLMYGMQNFPTDPNDINPNFIKDVSAELNIPFGYQDHSEPTSPASTFLPVLFATEGAVIIEKHITHDRSLKGTDYQAALNPGEFTLFVQNLKTVNRMLTKKTDEISSGELKYRDYKSLIKVVAKTDIQQGESFSNENLAVMRAKSGEVAGKYLDSLLGRKATSSYHKFECIKKNEMPKVGIFITVRLKSKRLPFKAIKPILGKPMIVWMIERLKKLNIAPLVIMTSTNPQDDPLVEIAKENNISFFRGSEEDVLLRMRDCARKFNVDLVISATGDNPLIENIFIKELIQKYFDKRYDFCEIKGSPIGCFSYGLSKSALEKVCEIKDASDTEIWGNYFRQPGIFKCEAIEVVDPDMRRPQYRVTIDTPEDFELVTKIFENFAKERDFFDIYDICNFLDKNPGFVKINSQIQQLNEPSAPKFKAGNN